MNDSKINVLTIDVEDYFQVQALSSAVKPQDWPLVECRVEKNTHLILDLLDDSAVGNSCRQRATFFMLGWIAERYRGLVREICSRGHEVASHGYWHQMISFQGPKQFREDVRSTKHILEDITGKAVVGYRAPTYSMTPETPWAVRILLEEGYKYDCSIAPVYHDYYGMPTAPRYPFVWSLQKSQSASGGSDDNNRDREESCDARELFEFPVSTIRIFGHNFPCAGGGYFRILPYPMTRRALKHINLNGRPFIFYLHPWELDPGIPRVTNIPLLSRFRTYTNLSKTKERFVRLLSEFRFMPVNAFFSNTPELMHVFNQVE
ncbi:MAG: XrtA system polysaccharide deacetylase [Smithellaceae bacterium]